MNAWDPKHTEEPDYIKRLNAHKKVNEAIKKMEDKLDVDFLIPVLHSCCYCIKMVREGFTEKGVFSLQNLCPNLLYILS